MLDARLFHDRYELLEYVGQLNGGLDTITEIGVALGIFSKHLVDEFNPSQFAAVDLFNMHESDVIWGVPTTELLEGMDHLSYYRKKFESYNGNLRIEQGLSWEAAERLADATYDLVYIDAGHDYDSVMKDALVSLRKVKPGGFMIFNDYTMFDHLYGVPYGVVRAANELITSTDRVKVVGLGLNEQMFCDLAVRVT